VVDVREKQSEVSEAIRQPIMFINKLEHPLNQSMEGMARLSHEYPSRGSTFSGRRQTSSLPLYSISHPYIWSSDLILILHCRSIVGLLGLNCIASIYYSQATPLDSFAAIAFPSGQRRRLPPR
jgi:hypothetical protein